MITALLFLLPASRAKNFLLRLAGHPVHRSAHIGPNIVWHVGRFSAGPGVIVGTLNVFRGLVDVDLGEGAIIGQLNWFASPPEFAARGGEHARLVMAEHSTFVSRHHVDCAGGVVLEPFALVGGLQTVMLTHQADALTGLVTSAGIRIGEYTLVNACNRMVPGSSLPARCITGMGSVVLPGLTEPGRVYAGVPAKDRRAVDADSALFQREQAAFGVAPAA